MLWVADITYSPTWTGFLYLAVALDAFMSMGIQHFGNIRSRHANYRAPDFCPGRSNSLLNTPALLVATTGVRLSDWLRRKTYSWAGAGVLGRDGAVESRSAGECNILSHPSTAALEAVGVGLGHRFEDVPATTYWHRC